MPNTGNAFVQGLAYCSGDPNSLAVASFDVPLGTLVIDTTSGIHYRKVLPLGTNTAGYVNTATLAPVALALTQALHSNRVVYVTDLAAAYTLPAATGTGDKYTINLGATITGASTIKVANSTDVMNGTALLFADGGATTFGFATAADSDTVDLLGTGNSTGGMIGAIYEFWDVAAGIWATRIVSDAAGTEATPFSATVS
jgi:hypothetical protein